MSTIQIARNVTGKLPLLVQQCIWKSWQQCLWASLGIRRNNQYFERYWRREFFRRAFKYLSFNGISGDYLEFGCQGMTFSFAHQEANRSGHPCQLWAFDSFAGLPQDLKNADEHPSWVPGSLKTARSEFELTCQLAGIPKSRMAIVEGFYDESLKEIREFPKQVALAYVDCDMYSSTKSVLEFVIPRLRNGAIVAFDDYFCFSETKTSGNRRAMLEDFREPCRWRLVPFCEIGWHGQAFIIEDKQMVEEALCA